MRECTEGGRRHWGSGLAPVGVPPRPLWALVPRCLCLHTLGERQLPLNSHAMTAARRDHVICDLVLNNSVSLLKFTVPPAFLGPSPQGEAGWALGTGPGGGQAAIRFCSSAPVRQVDTEAEVARRTACPHPRLQRPFITSAGDDKNISISVR